MNDFGTGLNETPNIDRIAMQMIKSSWILTWML